MAKFTYIFLFLAGFFAFTDSLAQRGKIIKAASTSVMDPNGDGYVSSSTLGFSNDGYNVDEFEIPMFGLPKSANGEVLNDIQAGANCGTTELTYDNRGFSVYGVHKDGNLIFRFRVANDKPSVEAYTILIDTDGRVGADDPNSTPENPGFEIDITLIKNNSKGVYVYNIDGIESCPSPLLFYSLSSNFQISVADEVSCSDPDYFYDYYVPFADVAAAFNINLNTELRFVSLTNVSATCAMSGKISDIGGVDDTPYNGCNSCAFLDLATNQCPTSLSNLCPTCAGFLTGVTPKPGINAPLKAGEYDITGTAVANAFVYVSIFDASKTLKERDTVNADGAGNWVKTLSLPLALSDSITAQARGVGLCNSGGTSSGTSFTVVVQNIPPTLGGTNPSTVPYTENDPPKILTSGIAITDPDDTQIDKATVSITSGLNTGQDVLGFTATSGITGSYDASTGILSLIGKASLASYQTVLRSVTYSNSSENPATAVRTVQFKVNDGLDDSNIISINVQVTPVNDAPVLSSPTTLVTYVGSPIVINSTMSVTDVDNTQLTGATVSITGNFLNSQDGLAFTNQNGISGSYNATTGVLTLTGTATLANYAAALSSVQYTNSVYLLSQLTRTVSFVVSDGAANSNTFQSFIAISPPANRPPVITDGSGTPIDNLAYTINEDTELNACINVTDPDGDQVLISGFSNQAGSGTLSISSALCFKFVPTANQNGQVTATITVCDQRTGSLCDAATVTITITPVNDAPVISSTVSLVTHSGTPVVVNNAISITDVDNTQLTSATVSITSNFVNTQDALSFTNQNGITGSYNATTGVLTLTGTATLANYAAALSSIQYSNSSNSPSLLTRTVSFVVNDGSLNSNTLLSFVAVSQPPNHAPVITDGSGNPTDNLNYTINEDTQLNACINVTDPDGDQVTISGFSNQVGSGTLSVTSGLCFKFVPLADQNGQVTATVTVCDQRSGSLCDAATVTITITPVNDAPVISSSVSLVTHSGTPVVVNNAIAITDVDNTQLTGAIVSITNNFVSAQDALSFSNQNGISGSYNASTGVLTLTGSASLANYATALSSIQYSNSSNNPSLLTRTVSFVVNDGALNSNTLESFVAVSQPPNHAPVIVDGGGTPTDNLNYTINEDTELNACINVTDADGDQVTISGFSSQVGSGTLSITSGLCFKFVPLADQNGQVTATVTVCDQRTGSLCDAATVTITITPVNDAPVLSSATNVVTYTSPTDVVINNSMSITDVDNTTLTGATVSLTNNFLNTEDGLSFTNQNGITGSYNATSGVLTLTGTASLSNYATALSSIQYTNSNGTPSLLTRTVSFIVNDGTSNSNTFLSSVAIAGATNNAPVINDGGIAIPYTIPEDTELNACISVTDPDGDPVLITGFSGQVGSGTFSITSPLCFKFVPLANQTGTVTVTVTICDQTAGSQCDVATIEITITPVNDAPVVSSSTNLVTWSGTPVVVNNAISVTDVDNTDLTGATVSITSNFVSAQDALSFTNQNGITGSYNSTSGVLTLTGTTTLANYATALSSIQYSNSSNSPSLLTRTVSIEVNDGTSGSNTLQSFVAVNQPPNHPPKIEDGSGNPLSNLPYTISEDTELNACIIVSDPDGDPVSISGFSGQVGSGTFSTTSSLCFKFVPVADQTGIVTATISVCDQRSGSLCATATVTITITPVNDAPVVSSSTSTVVYGGTPVVINNAVSVTDVDNTNLSGATVSLTGNFVNTQDGLLFTDQNGITGSYNSTTGVLTLTGNATLSNYAAALSSVQYTNSVYLLSQLTRTISFVVNDGAANSNTLQSFITITPPANRPPVITDGSGNPLSNLVYNINEDTELNACINVTDPDGDPIQISGFSGQVGSGTISITSSMCFKFVPLANQTGSVTATVSVCDQTSGSLCTTATVTINIAPVNDPPVITASSNLVTYSGTSLVVNSGLSISDIDNTQLTGATVSFTSNFLNTQDGLTFTNQNGITGSYNSTSGVLTLTGPATLADYASALSGVKYTNSSSTPSLLTRTVSFVANDGTSNSNTFQSFVALTTPPNRPPVIVDGNGNSIDNLVYTINEDTPLNACINAVDPDNDPVTISGFSNQVGSGTFSITSALCFKFVPTSNQTGQVTATVTLCDQRSGSLCDAATITINIVPVNDAPVITTTTVTVDQGSKTNICVAYTDVENDGAVFTSGTSSNGTITNGNTNDTCFDYQPNPGFSGIDNITVTICDPNDGTICTSGSVAIQVNPTPVAVNHPPDIYVNGISGNELRIQVQEDSTKVLCFEAIDQDGDDVVLSNITKISTTGGTLTAYQNIEFCFLYTPVLNHNGTVEFEATICDNRTPSLCATIKIYVDVIPVNDPPVITTIGFQTKQDSVTNFCVQITDVENDPARFTSGSSTLSLGTITDTNSSDLCFVYTPKRRFFGTDNLSITVCDSADPTVCSTKPLTVDVMPVQNLPPRILINNLPKDTLRATIPEDSLYSFCFTAIDPNKDPVTFSSAINIAGGGQLTKTADFCFVFKPTLNFNGFASWVITVCDDRDPALCGNLVVIVTVTPVNDPPVAVTDTLHATRFVQSFVNVLDNDTDIEFNKLSVKQIPTVAPAHGQFFLSADGELSYTSERYFRGFDLLKYTVCDDGSPSQCSEGTVIIDVGDLPLKPYDAFSPNGDGLNDYWRIDGIDFYADNIVQIFDRYNNLVYQLEGYNNENKMWRGESNHGLFGGKLPEGTYFYAIMLEKGRSPIKGFVVLKRE